MTKFPKIMPARRRLVVAALLAAMALTATAPGNAVATVSPFNTPGMWIWYVNQAEGGVFARIAGKAHRYSVRTVFIKSGDGSTYWAQFDAAAVALKSMGLRVCAWQYVYGANPAVEADVGARAVRAGAECLVIDAEREYSNRYAQAQTYISALRAQVGPNFPLALTSYAYPDYHPNLPYSVFLGPGGAQWNLPQMYFKAFGRPVPQVFAHTYAVSQVYKRPIRPLGQTYNGVRAKQVIEFRKYARLYRARGFSWWVWQQTRRDAWNALRRKLRRSTTRAAPLAYPELKQGANGDLVRWAQMHLAVAGFQPTLNGVFDVAMTLMVQAFQQQHGIPLTGALDQATWRLLLAIELPAAAPAVPPAA